MHIKVVFSKKVSSLASPMFRSILFMSEKHLHMISECGVYQKSTVVRSPRTVKLHIVPSSVNSLGDEWQVLMKTTTYNCNILVQGFFGLL